MEGWKDMADIERILLAHGGGGQMSRALMQFDLSSGGSPVGPESVWAVNQKDFSFESNINPDWDAYSAP